MKVRVREMTEADLPETAALEAEIFSDPWSEAGLHQTLAGRPTLAFVAEADGQMAGYFLGMQLFEEAEVYRIAVKPSQRQQGIGRRLMEAFLEESAARGAEVWRLEVRAGNRAARALYESLGFAAEGIRKHYYHNPEEDALCMLRQTGNNSPLEFAENGL